MSADAATSANPSVLEDLVDILYQPAAVFERRRETVAFGLAMILLAVLSAVVFFATKSGFDPVLDVMVKQQAAEILRANPTLTPEQVAASSGMMKGGIIGTMLAYPLIIPFLAGLLMWVVGKFFDSRMAIGAAIMVATYSYVPRFIGFIVASLMAVLLPEDQITSFFSISLSPARFLDPATHSIGVMSLLARLDLFLLWQTFVAGVGVSVLGGVSRGRGMTVAFLVWLLGFLPLIPALLR